MAKNKETEKAQKKRGHRRYKQKYREISDIGTLMQPTSGRMFLYMAGLFNKYLKNIDEFEQPKGKFPLTRADILRDMPYNSATKRKESLELLNTVFSFTDDDYIDAGQRSRMWNMQERTEDKRRLVFWDKSEKEQISQLERKPTVNPPLDYFGPVALLPSRLERQWLRAMIEAPEARFLLSDTLRDKLRDRLAGEEPIDFSFWHRIRLAGDDLDDEENIALLRLIFHAVQGHNTLMLEKDGKVHTLLPLRIRYNLWTNRYSLIALDKDAADEESRFPRYHLQVVTGLREGRCMPEGELDEAKNEYEAYCQTHRRCFHLRVRDERNGRERCYALFAAFDKTSYCESEGVYRLTIAYYTFDEDDVLSRLLALGPVGVVLPDDTDTAPEEFGPLAGNHLRSRLVSCLQKAQRWYQE